jgi:hypothetical protein
MANSVPSKFPRGSRVITLSAIPDDAECPIKAPPEGLIEVIQMSAPVDIDDNQNAIHVMFIYESESELEEHHAIVPFDWYISQLPLRILTTIPDSIDGIESTIALSEGPINQPETDAEENDSSQ